LCKNKLFCLRIFFNQGNFAEWAQATPNCTSGNPGTKCGNFIIYFIKAEYNAGDYLAGQHMIDDPEDRADELRPPTRNICGTHCARDYPKLDPEHIKMVDTVYAAAHNLRRRGSYENVEKYANIEL
jgi:hypothetical protein